MMCCYIRAISKNATGFESSDVSSPLLSGSSAVSNDASTPKILVKHVVIGISNDTVKDAKGVKAFETGALSLLREQGVGVSQIPVQ